MKINKAFLAILLLSAILVVGLFDFYGSNAWKIWNIPVLTPAFIDARIITTSSESYRLGFDPEIENPQDPFGRLFNLPSAWKIFFLMGLGQEHTNLLAGVLIVCFYVGFISFASRFKGFSAGVLVVGLFSPPVFLAVERGNVDLFVFMLCALSLIWIHARPAVSALFLWVAGALKIYPIFGFLSLLHLRKESFTKHSIFFVLAFALYGLVTLKNFQHAFSNTETGFDLSYGLGVLPYYVEVTNKNPLFTLIVSLLSVLLAIAIMFYSFSLWMRKKVSLPENDLYTLSAFRLGAGIYVGTFLLGNNWDYRLIFLLFTLPQLAAWANKNGVARYTLVSIIISFAYLWFVMFLPFAYFLDETSNWFAFAGLFYLLVCSLPEWVKYDIQSLFVRCKRKPA